MILFALVFHSYAPGQLRAVITQFSWPSSANFVYSADYTCFFWYAQCYVFVVQLFFFYKPFCYSSFYLCILGLQNHPHSLFFLLSSSQISTPKFHILYLWPTPEDNWRYSCLCLRRGLWTFPLPNYQPRISVPSNCPWSNKISVPLIVLMRWNSDTFSRFS